MKQPNVMQQNDDGTYSQAIPEPFGLAFKVMCCECGKKFWFDSAYRVHYRSQHTDGKRYVREDAHANR